jgi:hypothetical protein
MKLRNGLLAILAVLLVIVVFRAVTEEPEGALRTVPDRIQGTWVTNHRDYSDRYLRISANAITFGTGGVTSRTFEVTGFDHGRLSGGQELDTVYFQSADGASFRREFTYRQNGRPTLVFVNQPGITWTKQ